MMAAAPTALTRRGVMVAALQCFGAVTAAQVPPVPGPIEQLRPGDALWAPELAPEGPVTIMISLPLQRAYVYRNGVPIGVSTVSTGKAGHRTPVGIFTILEKRAVHRSNKYDDAPMPFMQRLTWDGVALHAGHLPGYPASHGCIRLPRSFAERLFGITSRGATVIVTDEAIMPEIAPTTQVWASGDGSVAEAGRNFDWAPERSPSGPLSIVISGRDRRVIVLRNGRQIGSAAIALDSPIATTSAYVLRAIDAEGLHWTALPMPGQTTPAAASLTTTDAGQRHLPAAFRAAVMAVLTPGATLLILRDSLASSGVGTRIRLSGDRD